MDIKIVPFADKEANELSKMIYEVIEQLEKENPDINYRLVREENTPDDLIKASAQGKMWVALNEKANVGTISLIGNRLRRFFVHPKYQGKGIGRKLVETAKSYAKQQNQKEIWVGSLMRAIPIYKKLGFFVVKKFYNTEINQEEMELRLSLK